MNYSNESNNFNKNAEESGDNQVGSNGSNDTQGTSDFGDATGTITDAVAGAMIGAPFGIIGTVIGGVSGGVIGNQMVESAEADNNTASNNRDGINNIKSINK